MTLISQSEMKKLVRKIVKVDPSFAEVIKLSPLCSIAQKKSQRTHYQILVNSILSQQLATKAAATISKRVVELSSGKLSPENMAKLSALELREAGVSGAKARAISELTNAVLNREIAFHRFSKLSNDEISEQLTKIWGIGKWTVEMFLMSHLGRLDIWPVGDLGVRRGWEYLHQLKEEIDPKELDELGDKFAGYQSVVAWYCWRALEFKN
ncbi:MAG: hypothetical protein NTZ31_02080 [Actinobacteria bacterium]|jgi:DNA-3-methyladenine glycosylase II|nr:hypothetical protein [Actinomycetota bacterium]